ncbi:MAG: DNA-processing protein DprA [[Clostridium] leptum]
MSEIITSKENPAVKHAARLLKSAKFRRQEEAFLAEGVRLCRDAAYSGVRILRMFYTEEALERYPKDVELLREKAERAFLLSQQLAGGLSATVTPQGIFCVCAMLDKTDCLDKMDASGQLLGLEDIQDPSNLGTVLRSAEALGIGGVILTRGCCDVYSPKVLRGSMGAVFRLPMALVETMPPAVNALEQKGFVTMAAVPDREAEPITQVRFSSPSIVLVGNEGNGLKPETIRACQRRVTIPMLGRAESLNASVAASLDVGNDAGLRGGGVMNRELFWIWLSLGLTPGSRSCKRILERFRTPEEFFRAPDDQWRSFRLPAGELSALSTRDLVQAEKISAACREKGIDLIAPGDQAYPNRLWEIPNPPALLYCQGVLPDLEEALCLAAVGTRSATEDGMKSAFELCYRLAGAGTVIVSGGALGADQAALEGALQAKGKTIAVLGGGADVDYPPNFAGMRKRILENGGAVLSEYPPATKPYRGNFPVRNRIISGLSRGVLVIEAPKHSGALITAGLALEQNRDVFALPGSVRSEASFGTNQLIKDGAKPVTCPEDILEEYAYTYAYSGSAEKDEIASTEIEEASPSGQNPLRPPNHRTELPKAPPAIREEELSACAVKLYQAMSWEPAYLDILAEEAGLSAAQALQAVTELELSGIIQSYSGRRYAFQQ